MCVLITCLVAGAATSSIRLSQLVNFEGGSNLEIINDAPPTDTNTLNGFTFGANKGGWELITNGGAGSITISTDNQFSFLRPVTLTNDASYTDAASTRCLKQTNSTQFEYLRYYLNGTKAKITVGFFWKGNSWTQDGNSYDVFGIEANSGEFCVFNFDNSTTFSACVHTQQNPFTGTRVNLTKDKAYWVSVLFNATGTNAQIKFYDPVTWLLVGTSSLPLANSNARYLAIGRYDDHQHAPSGSLMWYDNILIDDTGNNWPLFPASAWVADSPSRTDVGTVFTSSSANDAIVIPAGSNSWTSGLTLSKSGQTFSGISSNTVCITNTQSGQTDELIAVTANSVTISNLYLTSTNYGRIAGGFWGRGIELNALYGRVKAVYFKFFHTASFQFYSGSVFYKCMFSDCQLKGRAWGRNDDNWTDFGPASSFNYCSTNFAVWEDNLIHDSSSMPSDTVAGFTSQESQIWMFRHNTWKNDSANWDYSPPFDFHGPTGGGLRGGIALLLCSNYFNFSAGAQMDNFPDFRGGSGLVYSNVVTNTTCTVDFRRQNGADEALYFENGGIEQQTNTYFWANTVNGSLMGYTVESDDTAIITLNKSFFTNPPAFCIAPAYPFALRDDAAPAPPPAPPGPAGGWNVWLW